MRKHPMLIFLAVLGVFEPGLGRRLTRGELLARLRLLLGVEGEVVADPVHLGRPGVLDRLLARRVDAVVICADDL